MNENEIVYESVGNLRCIDEAAFSVTGLERIQIPLSIEFIGRQ
jgi:hypothetical protein